LAIQQTQKAYLKQKTY